jgi:predicted metallo-beta-lactamase superfamily hydrolase
MKVLPISSESYGVRSFCIKVITPDIKILLDPGCALGPVKQFKIPHYLEYERLHHFTNRILNESRVCSHLFISHYHHDHFKPLMDEEKYIQTSKQIFDELYQKKTVYCKQYRKTNYNQKLRGLKFHQDLLDRDVPSCRIGIDSIETKSFYYRNAPREIQKIITDSIIIGRTHLIFPQEFLHGIRLDGKQIYIQPLIINYDNKFFYFFADVQGMPSDDDLAKLLCLKDYLSKYYQQHVSNVKDYHYIALGGPFTHFLRAHSANLLLKKSMHNTQKIVEKFDMVLIDHHFIRDSEFQSYWMKLSSIARKMIPFNQNLFDEMKNEKAKIPILEFNRGKLYWLDEETSYSNHYTR